MYAYVEASNNFPHAVARFVSPNLPEVNTSRCLSFETMLYGVDLGQLDILDERNYKIWGIARSTWRNLVKLFSHKLWYIILRAKLFIASNVVIKFVCIFVHKLVIIIIDFDTTKYTDWVDFEVTLPSQLVRFVVQATRGGISQVDDQGDICIDNMRVVSGACTGSVPISFNSVHTLVFSKCSTHTWIFTDLPM